MLISRRGECQCETWSHTLRAISQVESVLEQGGENIWIKNLKDGIMENLHSEELRIRSRTNKWNGHIACKGKMRYNKFGLKTQRKERE